MMGLRGGMKKVAGGEDSTQKKGPVGRALGLIWWLLMVAAVAYFVSQGMGDWLAQ